MEQSIFESLLNKAESDSDYSENEINFTYNTEDCRLHFYSKQPFNTLRTYEFAVKVNGEWEQHDPKPYQVEQMMQFIQLEVPSYYEKLDQIEKDKEEIPYVDPYEDRGVSRADFI